MIEKNISLYEAVKRSALNNLKNPALLYMGKTITYKKLLDEIDKTATALESLGIGEGDIVTVCLPNIPEAVYTFYAISKIKAIAHMVHPLTKAEQMEKFLRGIPTKAIFIIHSFASGYFTLAEKLGVKIISCNPTNSLPFYKRAIYNALNKTPNKSDIHLKYTDFLKLSNANKNQNSYDSFDDENTNSCGENKDKIQNKITENDNSCGEKTAVLLHSGGTSGEPKAIELSANAINSLASKGTYILDREKLANKYMLSVLPMFHGFGLTMGIHALLALGGCDAIMPKFHRDGAIKLLSKGKINYIIGVPILYNALLSHPKFSGKKLKNIDVAFVGGDFVPKNLMTHFDAKIKEAGGKGRLFEGYGLTETVTVASVNTHLHNRVGSVGQALPSIKIEAFDNGERLARGTCGELYISGDTLMNGYLRANSLNNISEQNEKTEPKSVESDFFYTSDGEKWIKTGDYGYVDADGYIFFMQRLKRIIKVSGINVFPSEIENLIIDEPCVSNVCALEVTNLSRGAMIRLFVETSAPKADHEAMEKNFSNLIACHIGAHARPDLIIFMEKFPLTTVGKINSNELLKL